MIIGFAGYAGSGKDTAAKLFSGMDAPEVIPAPKEYDGLEFYIYALADPIKRAASEMFGIPLENFYDQDKKKEIDPDWGFSPRYIAQQLGTEGGRDLFRKDIWVKRAEVEYKNNVANGDYDVMLITDVRFPNEVDKIHELGGYVIKIEREDITPTIPHESEAWIEKLDVDFVVENITNERVKMHFGLATIFNRLETEIKGE